MVMPRLRRVRAGDAVLSARLKLIGSCRNAGDRARVDALRRLAQHLAVQDHVDFHVNAPWDEVPPHLKMPTVSGLSFVQRWSGKE
jgi:hypothetical protein